MNKRQIYIAGSVAGVIVIVLLYILLSGRDLSGIAAFPYISHQKPVVDPHLPASVSIADKIDEVLFDGLFNISANKSGIIYEDGLASFNGISGDNVVSITLKKNKKWHDSYKVWLDDDEYRISDSTAHYFSAADVRYTLNRILRLGSLSPDYILVTQAMPDVDFSGPEADGTIYFRFKGDRIWTEPDIKEVLSFKVIPEKAGFNDFEFLNGTGEFVNLPLNEEGVAGFRAIPGGLASIPSLLLNPFIDNSTFTTELKNNNINVLLETPFGSVSPVLDEKEFFYKSNSSTTFFAILLNTQKFDRQQRREIKNLIDNRNVIDRFFRVGTQQQRGIVDYQGKRNNYPDYLNNSVFPSNSYYVDEDIVVPVVDRSRPNLSILPDTIRIKTSVGIGYKEELEDIAGILNDPKLFNGKVKVTVVGNNDIKNGNYDALLLPFTGYRSNFLFDLYDIFLREPDLDIYKINLITMPSENGGTAINPASWNGRNNYFRIDAFQNSQDSEDLNLLLQYIYGFMSTHEIGDKQEYAYRIDQLENDLSLGVWMFSLPSLSYFSAQFDSSSIDLFGVASQLSTIEKWKERPEQ